MKFYFLLFLISSFAQAAPITISTNSNLVFGTVAAGTGPYSISPDTRETSSNASFDLAGDKNTAFTIILPSSATVSRNGGGVYNITVSNFTSYPAGVGTLGNNRKAKLFVGARINTVPINIPGGSYSGYFTVEVIY